MTSSTFVPNIYCPRQNRTDEIVRIFRWKLSKHLVKSKKSFFIEEGKISSEFDKVLKVLISVDLIDEREEDEEGETGGRWDDRGRIL